MLRLTAEREQRGWTKFELGSRAKIHPAEIGRMESGRIKPYDVWMKRLERVLGVSGQELFKEIK
jgi:ribosome-binding protein aMBF1 (putative translation factor)